MRQTLPSAQVFVLAKLAQSCSRLHVAFCTRGRVSPRIVECKHRMQIRPNVRLCFQGSEVKPRNLDHTQGKTYTRRSSRGVAAE